MSNNSNLLYHYTTQDGLLGILETKKIRATNLFFLNDHKELETAIDCATAILLGRQDVIAANIANKEIYDLFTDTIKKIKHNICIFVASFCANNGDMLSQWRGYSNNGSGYSIEFNKYKLEEIAVFDLNQKLELKLVKCIYNPDDQKKKLVEIIDQIINQLANKPNTDYSIVLKQNINSAIYNIVEKVINIAPTFKDNAFHKENEWRLVSKLIEFDCKDVKFRKGKSTLIPYIEIALAPLIAHRNDEANYLCEEKLIESITKVYVGPVPDMGLAKLATENLLWKEGYCSKVGVEKSKIPYRNW
jgi:Protein of unknown function (DUF2971)